MKNTPLIITFILVSAFSVIGGYSYGSSIDSCRKMVISDIRDSQKYNASLAILVAPDFLTAMGE